MQLHPTVLAIDHIRSHDPDALPMPQLEALVPSGARADGILLSNVVLTNYLHDQIVVLLRAVLVIKKIVQPGIEREPHMQVSIRFGTDVHHRSLCGQARRDDLQPPRVVDMRPHRGQCATAWIGRLQFGV